MMRKLPDWIGIGCVKCGTSWVWREIRKHPEIYTPTLKEIFFFAGQSRSLAWYSRWFRGAKPNQQAGEWTPDYFHHYEAMHRIKEDVPQAKLITIFRHPVERAFSNWKHAVYTGRLPPNRSFNKSFSFWRVRGRGIYSTHLNRWWSLFPKQQLKIMWYDDLKTRPLEFLKEIFQFIGVRDTFIPEKYEEWFNFPYHDDKINDTRLSDKDRKKWLNFYLPHTEKLEKMTDRDLSSWKV